MYTFGLGMGMLGLVLEFHINFGLRVPYICADFCRFETTFQSDDITLEENRQSHKSLHFQAVGQTPTKSTFGGLYLIPYLSSKKTKIAHSIIVSIK